MNQDRIISRASEDPKSRGGTEKGLMAERSERETMTIARVLAMVMFLTGLAACGPVRPTSAADYVASGHFRLHRGDITGALADVDHACSLDPRLAAAHLLRGRVLSQKGDVDGAIAAYSRAIELDPTNPAAWNNRAANRNKKMDYEGALADIAKALELNPQLAIAYNTRGFSHEKQGHLDLAVRDYEHALELDPQEVHAGLNLGYVRRMRGDIDGAIRDYSRVIQTHPQLPGGYEMRGLLFYNRREWTASLTDFQNACDRSGTQACFARLYIWLIRARLGEPGKASIELKSALVADGPHPEEDAYRRWYRQAGSFLLGEIPESQFLDPIAADLDEMSRWMKCRAAFYAGTKRLVEGDRAKATLYFKICSDRADELTCEASSAAAEIRALQVPVDK
jgi:tetratricopeptide (TPR) repeat protein